MRRPDVMRRETMTTTLPPARRLPAAAWGHMLLAEARSIIRDTSGLIIPIGLPTLLMVMNGLGQDADQRLPGGSTVMNAIIMPLTITMVVALVGVEIGRASWRGGGE